MNDDNSQTYHIGEFDVTDGFSTLNIKGVLKRKGKYAEAAIWLNFSVRRTQNKVNFKLSNIRARALIEIISTSASGEESFLNSGGNIASKKLICTYDKKASSFKLAAFDGKSAVNIKIPKTDMFGLFGELTFLIESCANMCYKLQRTLQKDTKKEN